MQTDVAADQVRHQHVAFEELADHADAEDHKHPGRVGPELRDRNSDREHEPGHRADIGHEGEQTRGEPDDGAELEPDQPQRNSIERAEDEADPDLTAYEGADDPVDLSYECAHGVAMFERQPAIQGFDHAVPIDQQIEGHDRHNHQERQDSDQRFAARP